MKSTKFTLIFILGIALFSCKKDPADSPDNRAEVMVTTNAPSLITLTTAISGGVITTSDSTVIAEKGICFSTANNPTLQNNIVISNSVHTNFVCNINGLAPNTTYFLKAYAKTSSETIYGNQQMFKTNSKGLLVRLVDSAAATHFDSLLYDSQSRLVKLYQVGGINDTFIYNNENLLAQSKYTGTGSTLNVPLISDYSYINNVLTSSRYHSPAYNTVTTSTYIFDNMGRLSQVNQVQVNGGIGSYPTFTTRFEYDANSNLSKIFYKQGAYPEYMATQFLNYDDKENPFYGLPFTFDYNIHIYNHNRLSKNNARTIIGYTSFMGGPPVAQAPQQILYEYNADGKVSKRTELVPGFPATYYFYYKYQ